MIYPPKYRPYTAVLFALCARDKQCNQGTHGVILSIDFIHDFDVWAYTILHTTDNGITTESVVHENFILQELYG